MTIATSLKDIIKDLLNMQAFPIVSPDATEESCTIMLRQVDVNDASTLINPNVIDYIAKNFEYSSTYRSLNTASRSILEECITNKTLYPSEYPIYTIPQYAKIMAEFNSKAVEDRNAFIAKLVGVISNIIQNQHSNEPVLDLGANLSHASVVNDDNGVATYDVTSKDVSLPHSAFTNSSTILSDVISVAHELTHKAQHAYKDQDSMRFDTAQELGFDITSYFVMKQMVKHLQSINEPCTQSDVVKLLNKCRYIGLYDIEEAKDAKTEIPLKILNENACILPLFTAQYLSAPHEREARKNSIAIGKYILDYAKNMEANGELTKNESKRLNEYFDQYNTGIENEKWSEKIVETYAHFGSSHDVIEQLKPEVLDVIKHYRKGVMHEVTQYNSKYPFLDCNNIMYQLIYGQTSNKIIAVANSFSFVPNENDVDSFISLLSDMSKSPASQARTTAYYAYETMMKSPENNLNPAQFDRCSEGLKSVMDSFDEVEVGYDEVVKNIMEYRQQFTKLNSELGREFDE